MRENRWSESGMSRSERCFLPRHTDSLFQHQPNETLVRQAGAGGSFANGVVKLLGQTQVNGLALAFDLEAHQLCAGKIIEREVGGIDERRRRTVGLKGRDFLFRRHRSRSEEHTSELQSP